MSHRKRCLQIVAARIGIHIDQFADEIEMLHKFGFHRARVDLTRRDTARRHNRFGNRSCPYDREWECL